MIHDIRGVCRVVSTYGASIEYRSLLSFRVTRDKGIPFNPFNYNYFIALMMISTILLRGRGSLIAKQIKRWTRIPEYNFGHTFLRCVGR